MGEKILARIKREWFHIASINNQGGFDTPAEEAFMGGTVSNRIVAGTKGKGPHDQRATGPGECQSTKHSRLHYHGCGGAMTCVVILQNPDLPGLLMLWQIAASARQGSCVSSWTI